MTNTGPGVRTANGITRGTANSCTTQFAKQDVAAASTKWNSADTTNLIYKVRQSSSSKYRDSIVSHLSIVIHGEKMLS